MPLHRRIHQPIATVKDGLSSLSPFPLHQYPPQRLALSRSRTRLQRFTHAINISSSLFVWILVVCALLTALYDMAQQFIGSSRESKASDLIITFGTYLLVVIIGLCIMISRTLSSKRTLASIPKGYIPTQPEDVSKSAHDLIGTEFERVALIARLALPKDRVQPGWGRPGTEHADVHFRTAILSTIPTLRTVLSPLLPAPPPPLAAAWPPRSAPLSPLAPLLEQDPSPVPAALSPLAELYEQQLVKAKYGREEPTEEDWDSVVKVVAVFVGVLGVKVGGEGEGVGGEEGDGA